ncbi:MAG: hypothetical protein JST92_04165, partial [Deltaproteobacteria bacterium]|nr:hypothetical protein [Deltaproteobacteria bacterium]
NTSVAAVQHYSGGEPWAEVVNEPGGLLPYAKKHVGELHFADLETLVQIDAHPGLFRWIRDAWFGNPVRDKIQLETPDNYSGGTKIIELAHARIHEVVLPGLDTLSRERRYLTLRILPRGVRRYAGHAVNPMQRDARDFYAQNFQVNIDGIDCSGVISVDPVTVRTVFPEENKGRKSTLVFPDIHLHVDEDKVDPFREWFEDFVIAGNNDDDKERFGTITYLEPLLGGPMAVLQMHHLGIYRVSDEPPAPTGPRRVRVDLYCERLELGQRESAPTGMTEEMPPVDVY